MQVAPAGGSASTRAAYGYYGTHWRAWRVADNNADTAIDQANTYYYDASWRLLEERIDEGHTPGGGWTAPAVPASIPIDSITQRVWGLEYIDELIYFHTDGPVITGAEQEGESEGEPTITPADGDFANAKGYYALVDRLYSVIGVADASNGDLVERVRYTPYGVARAIDPAQAASWGDVNGDGKIDAYDRDAASAAVGGTLKATSSPYDPDADFNRDNTVSFAEFNLVLANFGQSYTSPAEGQLSRQTIANTVGYSGYMFDPATEMYCVRFRWLSSHDGAWMTRDPAGYVSASLYNYVDSAPSFYLDPYGLQTVRPKDREDIPEAFDIPMWRYWWFQLRGDDPVNYPSLEYYLLSPQRDSSGDDRLIITCHGEPGIIKFPLKNFDPSKGESPQFIDIDLLRRLRQLRDCPDSIEPAEKAKLEDYLKIIDELLRHRRTLEIFACNVGDSDEFIRELQQLIPDGHDVILYPSYTFVPGMPIPFVTPGEFYPITVTPDNIHRTPVFTWPEPQPIRTCFTGETLVWTATGAIPIRDLAVGDELITMPPSDVESQSRTTVTAVHVHYVHSVLAVAISSGVIRVTPEHPFWVVGRGWVIASELRKGDVLFAPSGLGETVGDLETAALADPEAVYNLSASPIPTYLIGPSGVLVHNKPP